MLSLPGTCLVLVAAAMLAPAGVVLAAPTAGELTTQAMHECRLGTEATARDQRKLHLERGESMATQAVALDDKSAQAHFAIVCNLGEILRLDGEKLTSLFALRRLMNEVDRTLELDPDHVDAMATKGTLLMRLPSLLGGNEKEGERLAPRGREARRQRGHLAHHAGQVLRRARAARRGHPARLARPRDRQARRTGRQDRRGGGYPRRARRRRALARESPMAALSPAARTAALAALPAATLDLLVVGGGITGAGIARDAALRGLAVALVEAVDFAAGTSSRSSKLIHGGVRYLQQGDVALVREAASERARLRRIAPHLAVPLLMVMPTYGRGMHMKLGAGLWAFDKLATVDVSERHAMWDRGEALAKEPCLAGDGMHGAAAFVEYLTDDARLVLATVAGAAQAGALCVNHAEVTGIDRGVVTIRDALGGTMLEARARIVVNAAGPWVEDIWRRAGVRAARGLQLTKGIHLVVDHARLPLHHAVVMQARDRRSVFAVPRDGVTYIGTTDTLFETPMLQPGVSAEDAEYLLDAARRTFAGPPLTLDDVHAAWAGLRPLLREEGKAPSEISRRDEIATDPETGLISIAGGKLTTYRRMAQRVVNLVLERLGRPRSPSRTDAVPLPGGEPTGLDADALAARLPRLSATEASRLFRLHGAGCERILARVAAEPSAGEVVPGLPGVLRAEVEHALDEEMALTLEDLLERRTRSLSFDRHQGLAGVEAAATIAAARLGWEAARTAAEIDGYRRLAASLRSFG